jgi:hypothetical protein
LKHLSNIFLFIVLTQFCIGQTTDKPLKDTVNYNRTFTLEDKVYKVYNNYINAGLGLAYIDNNPYLNQSIGGDFNFKIKQHRLQAGGSLYGIRLNDFYHGNLKFGIGGKKETRKYLIGLYYGATYNEGFKAIITDSANGPDRYRSAGAYLQLQYAYKVKWDYGPALSLNFDWNPYRFISALRLDLFFSGAYQKKRPLENGNNW